MTTEEKFICLWKELESATNKAFPQWDGKWIENFLEKMQVEGINFKELAALRNARNALTHNPVKENGKPVFLLNEMELKFVKNAIGIINTMPKVGNITKFCKTGKLFSCGLDTSIRFVVDKMLRRAYSHVPVLDKDGKVIGVFSEGTLMGLGKNILAANAVKVIGDIAQYVRMDCPRRTDTFAFVTKADPIPKLRRLCVEARQRNKRLEMFFVTENGTSGEPLMGIVTVWDFVGMTDRQAAEKAAKG